MKRIVAVAVLAVSAFLLTGCTYGSSSDSASSGSYPESVEQHDGSGAFDASGEQATLDRSVITTGTVSLTVSDPINGASTAADLVTTSGGRVDARSESPATEYDPASASLTLRIPSDKLDGVLEQLKQLGSVNYISLYAADVTQQVSDIDARIAALETSVARLTELMATAETTADLIAIEESLSARQADLDSLIAQRDYLGDQVSYSTIELSLYAEGTLAPGDPDNFWGGLSAGWNALIAGLGGFLIALGFMLPGLLFLAALAGIALAIIVPAVRRRRRSKQAALEAWNLEQARATQAPAQAPTVPGS